MDTIKNDAIRLLRDDGRRSFSDIARELGVSRASITSRLLPLFREGSLRVISTVHPRLRGLDVFAHLRIRHKGASDALCRTLDKLEQVVFVSEVTGAFQVIAELHAESLEQLNSSMSRIRAHPNVLEVEVSLYEKILSSPFAGTEPENGRAQLDDVDIRLIELLQCDGRMSYSHLAKELGFSVASTRERVLRLTRMNVIHIGVVHGGSESDDSLVCGMGVNLTRRSETLEKQLVARPGLGFLGKTVGRFDLIATVAFASVGELQAFMDSVRNDEDVFVLETWMHLRTRIERYLHSAGSPTT